MHRGGALVLMVDGRYSFMSETVDAGDPSLPTPSPRQMADNLASPYGVWGALGTAAGGDRAEE
jgi:hypothetical protein